MAGDGPLREATERDVALFGLSDRIQFPGWINEHTAATLLENSEILCLPSHSEGLPMAAIEAASAGCAFVASAIPGVAGVIQEGVNGWTFPRGSVSACADALSAAMTDLNRLQARRLESLRIAQQFRLDEIIAQYESLFYSAAGLPR
jgi:glycosyltransferase involved in cell wall biosynthesis